MNEFKKHRLDKVKPSPFDPRDIYFSNTYEQHQETIEVLKKKGLWYEYAQESK